MTAADAAAHGHADHHGTGKLAARAVAVLGRLADDLVDRGIDEVRELDLRHRPQPVESHADGCTDDAGLG